MYNSFFPYYSIKATPEGGIWDTLKTEKHGMCGEYKYKYTVTKCDSTATDSIVIIVEDCCTENPHGDLVETELQGITTYDAFLLRYYLKHRGALQPTSDETFQLHLRDNICEEKIVPLRECFEKRADMNKDGVINEVDVKLLQDIIK